MRKSVLYNHANQYKCEKCVGTIVCLITNDCCSKLMKNIYTDLPLMWTIL